MGKSLLRRFIAYYRPHRKMLVLDLGASFLISATGMIYPIMTNRMLNNYIPNRMYRTIVVAGLIVLVLYVIRFMLRYFVQYYGHMIGVRMQSNMRRDLFAHLEKLPFRFYDDHETGKIMTIDPVLTLIIFACVPILIVVSVHFRKEMRRSGSGASSSPAARSRGSRSPACS